jgi:hypothetical protein
MAFSHSRKKRVARQESMHQAMVRVRATLPPPRAPRADMPMNRTVNQPPPTVTTAPPRPAQEIENVTGSWEQIAVDQSVFDELEPTTGENEMEHLTRIQQMSKTKQYQLDVLSRRLWLKNQTKKGREAPKDVQLARNALASKQLRAQALAAIPDSQQAAFSQLGMDPVHESANTVVSRPRTPPTPNSADRMYSRNLVVRRAGWRIWSQPQK